MYLHLGNNKIIRTKSIIGIFNADTATVSSVTKKFLTCCEKSGKLYSVTDEIPKSFILDGSGTVFMSQISASALIGRIEQ